MRLPLVSATPPPFVLGWVPTAAAGAVVFSVRLAGLSISAAALPPTPPAMMPRSSIPINRSPLTPPRRRVTGCSVAGAWVGLDRVAAAAYGGRAAPGSGVVIRRVVGGATGWPTNGAGTGGSTRYQSPGSG